MSVNYLDLLIAISRDIFLNIIFTSNNSQLSVVYFVNSTQSEKLVKMRVTL